MKCLIRTALAVSLAAGLATQAWAEPPKYKMTTDIPKSLTTPNKVETSIGTLKLLAWNVEMSQRGRARVTSPDISPELAVGDETRQSLTVVACAAPDLALSARVEASIGNLWGAV